jgi:hypothetical protein
MKVQWQVRRIKADLPKLRAAEKSAEAKASQ